jgi:glycine C-acetyltransferase
MVDDSHAVGIVGGRGRGTHEHCEVMGRVSIMTGTFGKALGGASGGYVVASKAVVAWLKQRSRPYLFSNSLAPAICAATLKALELVTKEPELRQQLWQNSNYFRESMKGLGFNLLGADHAIIPVLLGEAVLAAEFAKRMQALGIYVVSFSFPVVPQGQARIRTQMSAALSRSQIDQAIQTFAQVGRDLGVIQ